MRKFFRILIKIPLKECLRPIGIGFLIFLFLTAFFPSPLLLNIFKQVAPLEKVVEKFIQPKSVLAHYQFTPTSGTLVTGTEQTITSAVITSIEGTNVGSWKGTLADDGFHWVVGGTASGVDVQLDVGGVQLNGANTLMIQTEFDLDATVLATYVQICDWVDSTDVDNAADAQCTTGGWRTLNSRKVAITYTAYVASHWQIYDGYFVNGSGNYIYTPLSNFVNGNQIKIRYYSETNTDTTIAIDFLRVYAVINPVYSAGDFVNEGGGTVTGDYGYTTITYVYSATTLIQSHTDNVRLQVAGTSSTPPEFYLKFKNVKTYDGMNTIAVVAESRCSAITAGLSYTFKIRNFSTSQWEDISSAVECNTTELTDYFAKNNITISNYINGSNEIWIGVYGSDNSTAAIWIDHIYIMLGTTNTDDADCEISFGSVTAGRIAENPGGHSSDRINAMAIDSTYMYLAGYGSIGNDYRWRLEKRNLSDGELVTAFDSDGIVISDPSIGNDAINTIATTSGYLFLAGYDSVPGGASPQQWRIEKRNITTGALDTGFDDDGVITFNSTITADNDQVTAIAVDSSYLYITGFEDDDAGTWRIEKRNLSDGVLVAAFDDDGIIQETLAAAGDERPQAIKVDDNYLYIAGYDNEAGSNQWRIEKRNKTTGALCDGVGNCAAGAFDTGADGIVQNNPSVGIDRIYAMDIDDSFIYLGGYDLAAGAGEWRIEKRDITDGSLVTAFDDDGIIQLDLLTDVDSITDLKVDSTYLYITGYKDDDAGSWYIQKRNKTTGILDTNFSGDGTGQSEDGGDDRPNTLSIDGSNVYVAGYGTGPGDNQWLIEKRDISTGLRVSSGFGGGTCAGTRDIDTTSGDRNVWTIQTEDESTDFSHTFYAWDNDIDAVVEEAGSANIGFSVTVPSNAAVTGIFWAGREMSGAAGTVRLAIKDFSGLTGTNGGRSLVGGSATIAMYYSSPVITTSGVVSGGMAGWMTNPEDYIDTVNNKMRLNLNTTVAGATNVNSVNVWDFAMVSFSWTEDSSHPTKTYQFNPESGNLVVGSETTITSAAIASTEGTNVGSWKGTLADDGFHWVVAGLNPGGVDVQLDVGGVQLNGANKLIIQTEIDLDVTVLSTLVQICDWVDSTDVDNAADSQCTIGGWRTLNTKNASQTAVALVNTTGLAFQWHVYNGYWSTGTTGGTPIDTPLTNFINGSNQIKIRYYSTTDTTSQIAIDYLRIYAVIDPVYFPGGFVQDTGGTPDGHYSGAIIMGNTTVAQQTITGDGYFLRVPGDGAPADFYLKFKNIKTYDGMNTILVNTEASCSFATNGLQYRFKIRNFNSSAWEDISSVLDCSTTGYFNNFAKNNITISNYINGSNEVWIGMYALSNFATYLQLDHIYIMLGTTNTDANDCEISFGSNIAGRIAVNPSAPGADRIQAMAIDSTYMYLAGYDSSGIDNEWRLEKRNLSDGELVTAFDSDGIVTNDPSTGADQIFAIAITSDTIFVAGYDLAAGAGQWRIENRDIADGSLMTAFDSDGIIQNNPSAGIDIIYAMEIDDSFIYLGGYDLAAGAGQWRIEKRDIVDGSLVTAFDTDGIIQYNPASDIDQITAIDVDSSYLYITGFEDDDTGVWRIHKYDIITGATTTAFGTNGVIRETLAATGIERPQAIAVDGDYLYIAGYDNEAGNSQWRIEKRNKTTGALCDGVGNCAAGAFDTDGIVQINPTTAADIIFALTIDSSYLYLAGAAGAGAWRVEKRDITTGALDTNFSGDGIGQSEDGGDDQPRAIAVNGSYVYVAGYGTAPGDNQWLIEKRDITTGLRSNDSFGSNDCTGTRDIDITGGNRNAWTIQTEDESTDFSHPFYALDNDGDGVVEEAGSANIGFSVTVPSNAAVTGIFWAGRHMSGAAGTVRHAIKDFSGLTGTTGGGSLVGANGTIAMAYTDPIATGGITSGGAAGYMTNPEDYIDTVNNKMRLNLNTTADGASTTNSVNVWDFAMVSLQWIETGAPSAGITISGTIYTDEGSTNIGINKTVVLKVNGADACGGLCTAETDANGVYSISNVTVGAVDDVITVFLDGETEKAVTVTRASSTTVNITGLDLYQNRIIVRHEDSGPTTISDLDKYDSGEDDDILFTAVSSTGTLTASSTSEFFVWSGKTFGAWGTGGGGGTTTLADLDIRGTFTATSTQFIYISGNWDATSTATFNSASSTVTFTSTAATTTIKTAGSPFWDLTFNDPDGVWTFQDAATTTNDLTITGGTASSSNNMYVYGDVIGNGTGILNWTGGTFLLDGTGYFGGVASWIFYDLTFGDGAGFTVTIATSTGTTTVTNLLTIADSQTLNAGEKSWVLSGGGTPFVKTGTFTAATSTFYYTSTDNTTVTAAVYYNLNLSPAGTQTYNLGSGTLVTNNYLTIGNGINDVTVNADNNDPSLDVNGDFTISANATFVASQIGGFNIAGSWLNQGIFAHSNGTTTFDATTSDKTIKTGDSPFYNLAFNGAAGGWTFSDNATTSNNFTISNGTVTATSTLYVGGNWSATTTGIFQHNNGEVIFFATTSGHTISDGGWPFYLLTFNGGNGEWLYQDSTSTAPATTTVQAGTPTFLNAKTGAVSVDGGELLVDWYLGVHVVDKDYPDYDIDTGDNDITVSSTAATVWKWDGSNWLGPYNSTTTGSLSNGKIPHPATTTAGAVRIREYSKTAATATFYKYNLEIDSQSGFDPYDYYTDYEGKYITSTLSPEENEDRVISQDWHRSVVSLMNEPYTCPGGEGDQCINQPTTNGSWYIGMSSVLEFTVTPGEVELILNLDNYFTTTTSITLSATTSHLNGFIIKTHMQDTQGRLTTSSAEIIRFPHNNDSPGAWDDICNASSTQCGFGYTTDDNTLGITNPARFTDPNFCGATGDYCWAGFATSSQSTDPVATGGTGGESYFITLKTSVNSIQLPDSYSGTIYFICTVDY